MTGLLAGYDKCGKDKKSSSEELLFLDCYGFWFSNLCFAAAFMADCRTCSFIFGPKKRFDFAGIAGSYFCKISDAKGGNNGSFAEAYNGLQANKR